MQFGGDETGERREEKQARTAGKSWGLYVRNGTVFVQRPLLDIEERAVLIAENEEGGASPGDEQNCCRSCRRNCYLVCCDIGSISIVLTVVCILVGVLLLVCVRALDWPVEVDRLARYVISAGVFGLATGGTNAIAVLMLLYKVPLVCGSGSVGAIASSNMSMTGCFCSVFYKRHTQIKHVIKLIVLQQLFSSEHLQTYISKKIRQFSSHVQVTDSINKALDSPETAQLINNRLDLLFAEPEAQFLDALGVSRVELLRIVRPAVLSLCAETAPYVLDNVQQSQYDRPKVRVLCLHCRLL